MQATGKRATLEVNPAVAVLRDLARPLRSHLQPLPDQTAKPLSRLLSALLPRFFLAGDCVRPVPLAVRRDEIASALKALARATVPKGSAPSQLVQRQARACSLHGGVSPAPQVSLRRA